MKKLLKFQVMFHQADEKVQKLEETIAEKNRKLENVQKMKTYYQKKYEEQQIFLGKFNELDVIQRIATHYQPFSSIISLVFLSINQKLFHQSRLFV